MQLLPGSDLGKERGTLKTKNRMEAIKGLYGSQPNSMCPNSGAAIIIDE